MQQMKTELFKDAEPNSDGKKEDLLVKSRYLGSSFLGHARAEDLLEHFSNLTEFFFATRWVENKTVADRLLVIWPDIWKLFVLWDRIERSVNITKIKKYGQRKGSLE